MSVLYSDTKSSDKNMQVSTKSASEFFKIFTLTDNELKISKTIRSGRKFFPMILIQYNSRIVRQNIFMLYIF